MEAIEELLRDVPVFHGLAPDQLELIAGCGSNVHFDQGDRPLPRGRPGRHLLPRPPRDGRARDVRAGARAGDDRDARGRRGRRLVVAVPALPLALRRAGADAAAGDRVRRRLPARQVRGRSRARLRADVPLRAGDDRAPAVDEAPAPGPVWRRRLAEHARADGAPAVPRHAPQARDGRHVDARARARRGRAARPSRPGSSRCSTRSGSARCRSRSRAGRTGVLVHTVRAVGAVDRGDLRGRARHRARRARAVRQRLAARRGRRCGS